MQPRIAVIGDVMLDISYFGQRRGNAEGADVCVTSGFPEYYPGGAANVAKILSCIGCNVTLFGAVGTDWAANELFYSLGGVECVLPPALALTTTKTRIYDSESGIYRFDSELVKDDGVAWPLNLFLRGLVGDGNEYDLVLFSDYGKGVLMADNLREAVQEANRRVGMTVVDPHLTNRRDIWSECVVATPNHFEYEQWAHLINADYVVRTDGENGATLFVGGKIWRCASTTDSDHPQVVGAGDAFVAGLAAAISGGSILGVDEMKRAVKAAIALASDYVARPRGEVYEFISENYGVV